MKKYIKESCILILTGIVTLIVHACTAGSCFDETESLVKAFFYSTETKIATAPDSLTLYGEGMDTSMVYNKALNLKIAEIPLNAETASCRFVMRIDGVNDTVEFRYSSYPHLLSKECGYTFFFDLDTVIYTDNIIDSVFLNKKTITTFNEENIRIYF